jgi:hypothetical protein
VFVALELPTIWPALLMAWASLRGKSLGSAPRSMAWKVWAAGELVVQSSSQLAAKSRKGERIFEDPLNPLMNVYRAEF